MSYSGGAEFLDGPRFAAWIDQQFRGRTEYVPESLKRRLYDWRRGAVLSVYTADYYLVNELGLTLHDVPDDCWRVAGPDKGPVRRGPGRRASANAIERRAA